MLNKFKDVVWHLSWSITGNILAVSGGDNKVSTLSECQIRGGTDNNSMIIFLISPQKYTLLPHV